jgi:hypothetical protein
MSVEKPWMASFDATYEPDFPPMSDVFRPPGSGTVACLICLGGLLRYSIGEIALDEGRKLGGPGVGWRQTKLGRDILAG